MYADKCNIADDQFNTSVPRVKCIGDATFGPMLAHKAEEEGTPFAFTHVGLVVQMKDRYCCCRNNQARPWSRQLQCNPERRIHPPRSRMGWEDRARAEGRWSCLQGIAVFALYSSHI